MGQQGRVAAGQGGSPGWGSWGCLPLRCSFSSGCLYLRAACLLETKERQLEVPFKFGICCSYRKDLKLVEERNGWGEVGGVVPCD